MKMWAKNEALLRVLFAGLASVPVSQVSAQTFANLHIFTALNNSSNSDGAIPLVGLVLSGNTLYGSASHGGISSNGTIFQVQTDGTSFATLHTFSRRIDGSGPEELILSSNILYGTAGGGGSSSGGTVFAVNTDGTGFTNLHSLVYGDGLAPQEALILLGSTLFGTTTIGGNWGNGTVFAINTDGTGFTNLYSFMADSGAPYYTNSGGFTPYAGLISSANTLYGTAGFGGAFGHGTIFRINTDGTSFATLHEFTGGSDGDLPSGSFVLSNNTLYGTTWYGGSSQVGTVFRVNTDGTLFTNLHSFNGQDGASPRAPLVLSGRTLFGTTLAGGTSGNGAVFAVNIDGTDFKTVYSFTGLNSSTNSDGAAPYSRLVVAGNTLYGTASSGGVWGNGAAFSISLLPNLAISLATENVILTWPTNFTGFALQSTTNLCPSTIWTTNFPAPVVVNGLNTITNPISGTRRFFRLSQ